MGWWDKNDNVLFINVEKLVTKLTHCCDLRGIKQLGKCENHQLLSGKRSHQPNPIMDYFLEEQAQSCFTPYL